MLLKGKACVGGGGSEGLTGCPFKNVGQSVGGSVVIAMQGMEQGARCAGCRGRTGMERGAVNWTASSAAEERAAAAAYAVKRLLLMVQDAANAISGPALSEMHR